MTDQDPFAGLLQGALTYARLGMRVFPCKPGAKTPLITKNLQLATLDEEEIRDWWQCNPNANVGVAMEPSGLVGIDVDPKNGGDETWRELSKNLSPTLLNTATVLTPSGGQHLLFRANGYDVPSGVHALGPGVDLRARGGYLVGVPSTVGGKVYRWEIGYSPTECKIADWCEDLDRLRAHKQPSTEFVPDGAIHEGSRNATLFKYALLMAKASLPLQSILAGLSEVNTRQCRPPLPQRDIKTIVGSATRYVAQAETGSGIRWEDPAPWPTLSKDALHGFVGELVGLIEPHTEADPAALLVTALAMFGDAVGTFYGLSPHVRVGAVKHPPRIFCLLSGETAKARKGQSYAEIRRIFVRADDDVEKIEISGLSTGEGLINHVRDPEEPKYEGDVPKEHDKRAFVHESEFARVLTAAGRTECTLSPVLRDAWDVRPLSVLTRKEPLTAHDTYIGVLGHITQDELAVKITDTDIANGLLNRFLIVAVKRSKLLPTGGSFANADVQMLANRLKHLIDRGRELGEVVMSEGALEAWDTLYRTGFADEKGLAGAAIARGEAQTLRLSLIYALMDEGAEPIGDFFEIQVSHIRAAYALWQYAEASVKHILGKRLGNPIADRLLAELRSIFPRSLDFTEQRDLFGRHAKETQLNEARRLLEERNLIATITIPTKGRPKRVSIAMPPLKTCEKISESDQSDESNVL